MKTWFALCTVLLTGCSEFNKALDIPDDHLGEEVVEILIHYRIGIDIDLTPDSPEVHYVK